MNNIISSRWLPAFGAALLLLCFNIRPAHAVAITLGDRIDITASSFALPIQIVDAVGVSEWFLDLNYDPTDVQVNVGCDPFGGDSYCSLLTGPVTEGDFFAAGAPFNLLIPGFVELDPITFAQTGRLFGMHGAFGGFPPAPSGNGILAYIEFTILGTGDSPIDGDGTTDGGGTGVPVSEPGTLMLFAAGLALLIGRRTFRRGRRAPVALGVVASLSICGQASAQFGPIIELPPDIPVVQPAPVGGFAPTVAPTAAGSYLAVPGWSQTLAPNVRFVILSNFNSDAVLDRETGLVWARATVTEFPAQGAGVQCRNLVIGNRMGWRLPMVAELQSLLDLSRPVTATQPRLPVGHPFVLSPSNDQNYWASETVRSGNNLLRFYVSMGIGGGGSAVDNDGFRYGVLCVRGHDASRHMEMF